MRINHLLTAMAVLLAASPAAAAVQTVTFEGVANPAIAAPQELPNGYSFFDNFYFTNLFQSPTRPWYIVPSTSTTGPSNGTDYIQSSWMYFGSNTTQRYLLKSFDIASIDGTSFNVQFERYYLNGIYRGPLAITGNFQTVVVNKLANNAGFMGAAPGAQFAVDNVVVQAIAGVPEPATWLELGFGIGIVGAFGRLARRKPAVRAAA